jgi:general secretion pathway protein D
MNYTKLPKKVLLLLTTPVLIALAVPNGNLVAQSQTETKIRLMAEGLRARDNGDYSRAKANFEQLLVLVPNDVTVQRLLANVTENIAKDSTPVTIVQPSVVVPENITQVVYDPSKPATTADSLAEVVYPAPSPADELAKAEESRLNGLIDDAKIAIKDSYKLANKADFDAADAKLDAAVLTLPVNTVTDDVLNEIANTRNELLLKKSRILLDQGDIKGAQEALTSYAAATSPDARNVKRQSAKINQAELYPAIQPIEKVNPEFVADQKEVARFLAKGRSQYVAGDIDGAQETFRIVETVSADNAEAKAFLKRIADERAKLGALNRDKTRSLLIEEVAKSWQRPGVFVEKPPVDERIKKTDPSLSSKLEGIMIPSISFTGVDLGRVVSTLAAISVEYDKSTSADKGVNIVLGNQLVGATVPQVNITLRNMSLKRVLDIITDNVGYQYEIQRDLVLIKPSGTDANLVNAQFPVTKDAILRMTGGGAAGGAAAAATVTDPFAPATTSVSGSSSGGESDAVKRFLEAAGVPFSTVPGSNLAYDGNGILVTHTDRNIERIRNILSRYNDVRQVEIESKFMDVTEGALDELGIDWSTAVGGRGISFEKDGNGYAFGSNSRTIRSQYSGASSASSGSILDSDGVLTSLVNSAPNFPGTVDLGPVSTDVNNGNLAIFSGVFGNISVDAQLRALSRRQGTDLLSAPKVTVLSGNRATITIAQELRYPQSYGEIQSEVGTASITGGGGAGVTITAGTPQDFTTRNVGVELGVTPTVEADDYSISLELNPKVTEFEGFVEYGGQSVAISSGTTVTVPSGFFQPIFSLREINTRVMVWDGATLVMGGLTREEVKRINDKVPILGDIPYLGRAFRSKGETSQKRNLLVFVTANLVSPGGSLKKQELRGVAPSSIFQNPTVVTPGGSESRIRSTAD